MSRNISKKIFAIVTSLTMMSWVALPVSADTVSDLQAQIAALTAQLAALQAQLTTLGGSTPSGTPAACAGITFSVNLSQGSTGASVKCLQAILNLSADTQVAATGSGSPGNETTYFGSLTKAAVVKFQQKYTAEVLTPVGLTAGTGFVGAQTRAKLNTILTSGGGVIITPGAAMSVTLAATSPAGANIWRGTANNIVAKITFTGGTTATNITGLVITNYGTTESTGSTDLSAIKVYDENMIQIGADRTIAGNRAVFVFVPNIAIAANGSRTLTVAVNVGSSATVMSQVKLGITAATDITGATFTGAFPVYGNAFTIVPAGSIGSLSVGDFGAIPKTTVKIGEKDIILEKFTVAAGANEDVSVNQITVTNSASSTISDSDIANIRIREVGGAVVAGPVTLLNKKATFNFATPVLLVKGTAKNFEVIADIVAGENRTIYLYLASGNVVGKGSLSGANLQSTTATTPEAVTIGSGTVSVSMSTSHPQGANALLIQTTNRKTIAVFSVRAAGEDIIFSTMGISFSSGTTLSTTNYLSSVGLYDGDALISSLADVTAATTTTFSLNWTVPANTTKDLTVKAITNTLADSPTSQSVTLTFASYAGYGLSSGNAITGTPGIAATAVTIYTTGTATLAADSTKTPFAQGILSPVNGVVLGALKVYAQREDQKLNTLVLTESTTSGTGVPTSVALYSDDGTTQLSNQITPAAATNTYTFTTSDLLSEITFTKGVYKTLVIKGTIPSTASGTVGFHFTIASTTGQFKTVGVDSGATFDANGGTSLPFDYAISSPYAQGTFSFSTRIVEVKKNASSPSGDVARGSFVTYAAWDLSNVSSDLSHASTTAITFTSKTGLPAGLATDTVFRLYDDTGVLLCQQGTETCTVTLTLSAGTVAFAKTSGIIGLDFGAPKTMQLRIDTTNTTYWPVDTQMQWTIGTVGSMTVNGGFPGFGGTTYSIPADTNLVQL